jgi:hypothetical protein
MMWGIGLLLIVAGTLCVVYAMQGEPVITLPHLPLAPHAPEPVGEGVRPAHDTTEAAVHV